MLHFAVVACLSFWVGLRLRKLMAARTKSKDRQDGSWL